MEAPQPGHFWKNTFFWDSDCPAATESHGTCFAAVDRDWLVDALAEVMANSVDESDNHDVQKLGHRRAAIELLAVAPSHFIEPEGWWKAAVNQQGQRVGFVLPVLFKDESKWKEGRPQGTIFYVGVLPAFRGQGYSLQLVAEATRSFAQANCWRAFCDTSSRNAAMISTFRRAGYKERAPWQRPIAYEA